MSDYKHVGYDSVETVKRQCKLIAELAARLSADANLLATVVSNDTIANMRLPQLWKFFGDDDERFTTIITALADAYRDMRDDVFSNSITENELKRVRYDRDEAKQKQINAMRRKIKERMYAEDSTPAKSS